MRNNHKLLSIFICSSLMIAGCATQQLLPTGGPTSKEIITGEYRQMQFDEAVESNGVSRVVIQADIIGSNQRILNDDTSLSINSSRHLQELNADFKEVPNPQILGYVYPHFDPSGLPVPGYFTAFRLYPKNHYALMHEAAGVNR